MSQSSDNPIRQARRRGWAAQKVMPDRLSQYETRASARKTSQAEFAELTQLWLAGIKAAETDQEARDFYNGTEPLQLRRI